MSADEGDRREQQAATPLMPRSFQPEAAVRPSSLLVGLGELTLADVAITVAKLGLAVVERLLDAVDHNHLRDRVDVERIAVPDDDVGAAASAQRSDLARPGPSASAERGDRRERLAPAEAGGTGTLVRATRLPAFAESPALARFVLVDRPMRT
jgi:Tfp pilus assembly protein FimV